MPTLIKAQCPFCQANFSVPKLQLNTLDAKIRCEHCQQIFLGNENLIVFDEEDMLIDDTFHSSESTKKNTQHHNDKDTLIYDDMPIDALEETDSEDRSIDEMNVWFSDIDTTLIESTQKKSEQVGFKKTIHTDKPLKASNDITASIDHSSSHNDSDNAWLEEMLEEQKESVSVKESNSLSKSNTDLSQLLTSMGVPPKEQSQLSPRQVASTASRDYSIQNRAQNSAALVLWIIGCLVLVMLLFAQYVIFNLNTLVKNPEHAARLQAVCAVAACSLPSANIMAFNITNLVYKSSAIQAADTFSDITASLTNESTHSQLLPSLKVSVYNDETLLGAFIALPEDYLASKQNSLPAQQDKAFMFTIPIASNQISRVAIEPIY